MAITRALNYFLLTAAGDVVTEEISIHKIIILKAGGNGTVSIRNGSGEDLFTTRSINSNDELIADFSSPWPTDGLELEAVSAGTATVGVFFVPNTRRHGKHTTG